VEPSAPSAEPADIAPAPAAQTTDRVSISSSNELDNTSFEPLFNPRPLYPLMAQRASIQGFVDVELFVDEGGRVERFSITNVSGHPGFGNETAKVIGKWRFPPPRIGGKAVKVRYPYRVYFKLQ
jgi:TonB family protein